MQGLLISHETRQTKAVAGGEGLTDPHIHKGKHMTASTGNIQHTTEYIRTDVGRTAALVTQ